MGLLSGVTNMLFGGGGGGGGVAASGPSSSNVTQTSIPEYARPYVETMLGQSAALTDINKNPYQPYGGQRLQAFTPMQEQAFQNYANQQVAGQLGAGTGLAAASGLSAMGAGADYARMATDPRSIQSYMSPYMQNVVDLQKQEAVRDYTKGLGALNARAVGSGAFGGTRASLERAEAGRNLNSQLANIQAQGTQNAFNAAQQAQQFGANIGLQGYGQGLQAASTLGQLGQTQFGQQQAISDAMAKAGAVQQAQGQQALDLAYGDYTQQKQYPYQQLAFMSDMLRGLPLSQAAQQQYTAPPSMLSQLGGLGATALGVYGASGGFKAAKGGEVKSYADGGSVVGNIESQLYEMDVPQLTQIIKTSPSASIREKAAEVLAQKQMASQTQRSMGIESAPAGNLDDIGMAGGGIIAFNGEGESLVKRRREPSRYDFSSELGLGGDRSFDYGESPMAKAERELAEREAKNKELVSNIFEPVANFLLPGREYYSGAADTKASAPAPTVKSTKPAPTTTTSATAAPPVTKTAAPERGIASVRDTGGKYEKEIEAGLAELRKGLGEGRSQKDLDELRQEMRDSKDQNLWMALIQGGAKAMQSTSPHALAGLGAGIEEGAKAYGKGLEGERADKKLLLAQQSALEQVEYARKSGNLNALIQAQSRLDAIKAQRENLGASKELAILSSREKARGETIQKLMYQNGLSEEEATAIANRIYPSTIGTATATSEAMPKGVVVRKKSN